ncbi:MAG TPA: S53 family peptidase [Mycobacteriales bacterium]|nr:S53 family peptidase [Mycobacteriales bacterium]
MAAAIGALPATAATPRPVASSSITVQLASGSVDKMAALARTHDLSPGGRLRELRALLPSAATRAQTKTILARWGFRVTHETAFTISAVATADRLHAAFPRRSTDTGSTGTLAPGILAGLATSVVDGTTLAGSLHPTFTPTEITGADARQLYDTTDGTPLSGGSAPTIATLQFSGWDSSDFATFAGSAGLPDPVSSGQYASVSVDGANPSQPDGNGGEGEVALDQESLLSAAPHAPQRAYFAPNSARGEVDALEQIASDAISRGNIGALSISWGECEADSSSAINALHQALTDVLAAGVTVFAASGDSGAFDCNSTSTAGTTLAVDYPASDPLVVAVGGTTVDDTLSGAPQEKVWWDPTTGAGSGGGISTVFPEPSYQAAAATLSGRGVPDIALDADPASGMVVVIDGSWAQVGGTSLASPLAAATFTDLLASSGLTRGVGDIHAGLYTARTTGFRDVTLGDNGAFTAGPGYDEASGLGAPQWNALAPALVGYVRLAAPSYTRSRTIPLTITPSAGTAYTGWRAGIGTEPSSCDATGASATQPTQISVPTDGRYNVWVVGYANGLCYLDDATTTVDTVTPVAAASAGVVHRNGIALTFHWSGTDAAPSSGIARYAVTVTHAGSTTPDYRSSATRATSLALTGRPGRTYTIAVTVTDNAGNTSAVRRATVTLPYDDRSFIYSTHWSHASASSAYLGTLDSTSTRGANAHLTAVGRTYAVLVMTCPTCGSLTEYVDGHRLRTVSLKTASRHYLVALTVAHFSTSGRHTVKLVDAAGHVYLDGLTVTA